MYKVNNCYNNDAISELEQGFFDVLPEGYDTFGDVVSLSKLGPDALLGELLSIFSARGGEILSFFLLAFGASVLIWLSGTLSHGFSKIAEGGVSCISSVAIFGALYPLFLSVGEALGSISAFFSALVPILSSFLALGGAEGSALSLGGGMTLTAWLIGMLSSELLLPIVSAVFAASVVSGAYGGALSRLADGIKKTYIRAIGFVGVGVAALFALQTYIGTTADGLSLRAAKFAAGGLVPVVGNTVSGALATLIGGLSSLGGIIGASSVAVIVAMALSPFVILLLYKLALFLCSLFLDYSTRGGGTSCISAFSGALDALIAVYSVTVIIYIFEVVLVICGGGAVYGWN
ncbi:MAG: hypothetical protein IKC87_03375 [Clostridia bacterium]|nr:hypothetical protein [Clostridia bacterium]